MEKPNDPDHTLTDLLIIRSEMQLASKVTYELLRSEKNCETRNRLVKLFNESISKVQEKIDAIKKLNEGENL